MIFKRSSLQQHQANAKPKTCDSCDRVFCHESHLERHKRSIHFGGEIRMEDDVENQLDKLIAPKTGFEEDTGYKAAIDSHWSAIRDSRKERSFYMEINKKLSADFTYKALRDIITEICQKLGHASKINIGFGFMLRDVITGEYRYFYASGNTLLFDRAVTLSKMTDVNTLMKRILDIDLAENYFMKKPLSGWTFVGLTNIFIKVMFMKSVIFG